MSLLDETVALEHEKEQGAALGRALHDLRRAKAKTEDLVDAVYRAVRDAMVAEPKTVTPPPQKDGRRKSAECALWHLTDWQGAKLTPTYNREVMRARVFAYIDKAQHITNIQRAAHPVRDCVVLFGGDMVEGLFQFPTQPFEIDASIFGQYVAVSTLLVETVRRALGIYDRVKVVAEWGNHGRIGSKRDAVPTSDNIDRMCYEFARTLLAPEKRLTWEDCPEDIQKVEIGDYRAILLHGDETGRNGYVSDQTFLKYLNSLKAGAYDWPFRDAYTGHYHTHKELAMADGLGAWYQTGSTESDNRYARDRLGSSAKPTQRLHFVDPMKGRVTCQYKVWLP